MKEKLEVIREALTQYTNVVKSVFDPNDFSPKVENAGQPAREALALLDTLIAELDKGEKELQERRSCTHCRDSTSYSHGIICDNHKIVATNITTTRDRE